MYVGPRDKLATYPFSNEPGGCLQAACLTVLKPQGDVRPPVGNDEHSACSWARVGMQFVLQLHWSACRGVFCSQKVISKASDTELSCIVHKQKGKL